jgi:hypothetical protein
MGMEISENFQGAGVEDDPIFKFKPWPIGGTTNSLSLRAAISSMGGDVNVSRGDVNVRKREGGKLSAAGQKRQAVQRENRKKVVAQLRKGEGKEAMEEEGAEGGEGHGHRQEEEI